MSVVALIRRLREEFTAMPHLRLSEAQVQRLCDVTPPTSTSALRALVSAGFLCALEDGTYQRTDTSPIHSRSVATPETPAPWRRIMCLVEFEDDSHQTLAAASHSALAYAITLGVTHRARVTALHLAPSLPSSDTTPQRLVEQLVEELRKHPFGQSIPGLIDVHVAIGASHDGLFRAARDVRADLIIIGRRDGGAACLSQLRDTVGDAPCHVLVVHPSGQAAVA